MSRVRSLPGWLLSGALIIPVVAVFSVVVGLVTSGRISYLFWLVVPSIVFEEAVEGWGYALSNSMLANFVFALVFWFVIGATVYLLQQRVAKTAV